MEVTDQLDFLGSLPPGKNPNTHEMGGWVGHGAGLSVLENRNVFY